MARGVVRAFELHAARPGTDSVIGYILRRDQGPLSGPFRRHWSHSGRADVRICGDSYIPIAPPNAKVTAPFGAGASSSSHKNQGASEPSQSL